MKCERAMEHYLAALDTGDVPADVRRHIDTCPKCGEDTALLSAAMGEMRGAQDLVRMDDIADAVMTRIRLEGVMPVREVPVYQWIAAGIIIFGGMMLVTFSQSLIWLKSVFGRNIEVPMSLVLGMVITIYAAIFVGTHLDELSELVRIDRNGDERLP